MQLLDVQHNDSSNYIKENNLSYLPKLDNTQLLEEQKKHFKDYGKISDEYLLP